MRKQGGYRGFREAIWDELLDEACPRRRVLSQLLSILSRSLEASHRRAAHSPESITYMRLCTSREY
jgi:hypothetical protein